MIRHYKKDAFVTVVRKKGSRMAYSKFVLTLTGISLIAVAACTPRQSVTQAAAQSRQDAALFGVNGAPLYQSASLENQESNNLPTADYQATGTIKSSPQAPISSSKPMQIAGMSATNTPTMVQPQKITYRVQAGDTIYSIGRKFKTSPNNIIASNNMLDPNRLEVGQPIIVPSAITGQSTNNINSAVDTSLTTGSISNPSPIQAFNRAPQPTKLPTGQQYIVQAGDTIYAIGRKFNIHPKYIMNQNPAIVPHKLSPGQVLNIAVPGNAANNTAPLNSLQQNATTVNNNVNTASATSGIFQLPVQGAIQNNQGLRGILISAKDGDAVKASADGEVIYVGNLNRYGNMILVRHKDGLVTNYARLKRSFVKKGQKVSKGDLIASAGASKDFNTADVLFEVRKGTKAVNPMQYLG